MTYSVEQARKIYAMGFVPAKEAGFDPYEALKVCQEADAGDREFRATDNKSRLHVGKVVSDGKRMGKILSFNGSRVTVQGYLVKQSIHIADLTDWSFRAA